MSPYGFLVDPDAFNQDFFHISQLNS